jgi:hypothetical protein
LLCWGVNRLRFCHPLIILLLPEAAVAVEMRQVAAVQEVF